MKKISIITIFDNPNFGTYLQALALGIVLKRKGINPEIVHYERPIWHSFSTFRKKTKCLEPLRFLLAILKGRKGEVQRYKCRYFVRKYISVTAPYYSFCELLQNPPIADIYLTGSDQVWNTIHNHGLDKSFYLGWVPQAMPKYAYAASIGMDNIPKEYVHETKSLLEQYRAISVREQSNVDILKGIGIESQLVLDPTLLLTAREWKAYEKDIIFKEPYVLVYSVESSNRDKIVGEVAAKVADILKCKIYEVSYFGENKIISKNSKHFYYATPDLFLALVSQAKYIVGSSFHITAFAINYNKPFLSVSPDRFSSRIDSLLNMTRLQNRKLTMIEDFDQHLVIETIDFSQANSQLDSERKKSFSFINSMLT